VSRKKVSAAFDGGRITSDGGVIEGQNAEVVEANLTADQRFGRYEVVGQGPSDINGHIVDLTERLAERIDGGVMALLGSVGAAIAAVDAMQQECEGRHRSAASGSGRLVR
jgi:hypothetical protein